ncbi:MAG: N-6 DNA methylase [Colwellia sp.]
MRQALDKLLRSALESTVIKARDIIEQAAREAIERLGIQEGSAPGYLTEAETKLRVQLRAHGRHLGDLKSANGEQEIELLISEAAYEHWHRMLFARFLEQNNLLMYDASTHVTLEECSELAADEGFANGWAYVGHLASKMLPQVFRQDSAVLQLELTLEHVRSLEQLIEKLDPQTFQAQDSLGWVYQFWQTKRKEQVNKSEVKIGAKELSPVTQLFTEPYMVSFLLDNALGAWWANRTLKSNDIETAKTEQDLRDRASIPGVPLTYLRFVQNDAAEEGAEKRWQPAAGKFEQWPQHLSELKTLDPCCGSGHFLVAAFSMLVPMRMQDEGLSAKDAVNLVLSQNIHGLELDQRCVELAAFALALEAWRFPDAGGYRTLPKLHLACSGLSVNAAKSEWKELGIKLNENSLEPGDKKSGKKNLSIALDWMHKTFEDAPVLGSLINPRKSEAAKIVQWDELEGALNQALTINVENESDEQHEASIVAQGMAKAASLLAGQYSWVITNVPYLKRGKQYTVLKDFCETHYTEGKNDLATVFLDRCLELCEQGGTSSIVLPQNWLFLKTYEVFREKLLQQDTWNFLARLGSGAFETISGEVVKAILISITRGQIEPEKLIVGGVKEEHCLHGMDVSDEKSITEKINELINCDIKSVEQVKQLDNPDGRISFDLTEGPLLQSYALALNGLHGGDSLRFRFYLWEVRSHNNWRFLKNTVDNTVHYSGSTQIFYWPGQGELHKNNSKARIQGDAGWGKAGISSNMMSELSCSLFTGEFFDISCSPIIPKNEKDIPAIWCYCSSPEYNEDVREIDQALKVTNATLVKVPFDLEHWTKVAEEQYPRGLPQPYTNDPTQWIFHGHPCGSAIWHEQDKKTAMGELRKDDTVLQTALARLLGYQWPAETDAEMELAEEQRHWVKACEALTGLVDDDGIACIPAIRGEKPAADRLEAMLQASYGDAWNINVLNELLASVKASSLDAWLRDKFFDQHCKMFGHRPFIWQIWDGLKDGFSALVNYHQLDADNLDRLIYTYLGDWIRSQEQGVKDGVDGADIRLAAAQNLKAELEAIKQGEALDSGSSGSLNKSGYDIFVRWKPTHEQPMGWNPDLNDGVRLNIRPFMTAKDMGKKGAGILRGKPNVHWKKDRGTDVESAPWYTLGEQYGEKLGSRINDHHLTLADKQAAKDFYQAQQNYIAKAGELPIQEGAHQEGTQAKLV